MHNILMIVRREYRERVRKPSFWIGTLLFPTLMIGMIFAQVGFAMLESQETLRIALVDQTGRLHAAADLALAENKLKSGERQYELLPESVDGGAEAAFQRLRPRILSGELFGALTVGENIDADDNVHYYTKNVGNADATRDLERALSRALMELRIERASLSVTPDQIAKLTKRVEAQTVQVSEEGESKRGFFSAYFSTFIFVFLLYMSLLIYGIMMLQGVLEEKSSRIMEVLLGSVSPTQLMTGKILGIGLVGLTQVLLYALTAGAARAFILARGAGGEMQGFVEGFSPLKLAFFVLFFVLGYFLYVSLFAAIGSVCNSMEEAQNLQTPVVMCLVIPMIATFLLLKQPDSTASIVFSLIPLFTPMVMFMRIMVLTPPWWQIALSILLMVGTIWLVFRGVAKVFRIGVLMYGKRPTIPEIFRWAKS